MLPLPKKSTCHCHMYSLRNLLCCSCVLCIVIYKFAYYVSFIRIFSSYVHSLYLQNYTKLNTELWKKKKINNKHCELKLFSTVSVTENCTRWYSFSPYVVIVFSVKMAGDVKGESVPNFLSFFLTWIQLVLVFSFIHFHISLFNQSSA